MRLLMLLCVVVLLVAASCTTAKKSGPVLNHIALYTQSLKKSTDFYQKIIGLDTIPEPFHDGKHTWFTIGGGQLHLIEGLGKQVEQNKNTHLCFSVPSVPALIERLNKAAIPYEDWPGKASAITTRVDGVHQIYFRDPDGHWIEINDDKQSTRKGQNR